MSALLVLAETLEAQARALRALDAEGARVAPAVPEPLLSMAEARAFLGGVGEEAVRLLAKRHPAAAVRVGRSVRYQRAALLAAARRG